MRIADIFAVFPCQAFSVIGRREGFADTTRETLFFEIERILRDKTPPASMLENVRNLKSLNASAKNSPTSSNPVRS